MVRNSLGGAIRPEGASGHGDAVSLLRVVEKSVLGRQGHLRGQPPAAVDRCARYARPGPAARERRHHPPGRLRVPCAPCRGGPGAAREPDLDTEATAGSERPCRSCVGDDLEGRVCRIYPM